MLLWTRDGLVPSLPGPWPIRKASATANREGVAREERDARDRNPDQ
jgi:hypothetical protein